MPTQLSRYYSVIVPVAIIAASLLAYQVYVSTKSSNSGRLKRSNARRVSRRNPRRFGSVNGTGGEAAQADGEAVSDERLHELQGQATIEIPDSLAGALVEAAVAAQEARGAGSGGGGPRSVGEASEFSYAAEVKENQNLLNLLYLIAEDQSKRDSFVHRGVTCNSCNCVPIRGIRYRCANCIDFDLCETCEALDSHPKTHLFYKVRIPAPFLGNPRQAQTPWYPGRLGLMPSVLPAEVVRKIVPHTGFDPPELEALYEQFKCLAATEYEADPLNLGGAISRQTFDKCFVPGTHVRPPPPNLIYDRMFDFYDTNKDGLIGFEEFVCGLSTLNHKQRASERLRRIFNGYDLDEDGYVDRKDFLRMFRAYYALSKDLVKDMVTNMEDDLLETNHSSHILLSSQPISAAFAGGIPPGSRRVGKEDEWSVDRDDDDVEEDVVLPSAEDRVFGEERARLQFRQHDVLNDPEADRARLLQERRRRIFSAESDSAFLYGADPLNPEPEVDVGSEVLYLITKQALDELLDILFAEKEELALQARDENPESTLDTSAGKEVEERGEGKLNFEEFEKIMKTKKGTTDLGFVATWIEMANF